ncbi:hypothetical protein [Gilvibacter sediminis]|uniref:hypothetical protein n=1 Tax=Gilvibacter sediminis TaxID=379071 RepID=UPI00234FC226|nr:hypothetical protein [Gilvibacter sediminis]MDC7997716.1 hypothetical protein [Gilvibacter sediminis]
MKKLTILFATALCGLVFMSTRTNNDTDLEKSLRGVWELKHQTMYENDLVTDTIYNLNGYRQVKIYSKGHIMWTRFDATDSNDWFGYGTYEVKDGMLIEYIEYGSKEMMKALDTIREFSFRLDMDNDTYSQIAYDDQGNLTFAENYVKIE